jgi:hypothetical protein
MDFATLKSRVLALIGRAPADVVYELVTADINADLRMTVQETKVTITEAASMTLPADFLSVVDVYRDVDPRTPLSPTTAQAINRTHSSSGTPSQYAIVDGAMVLNPSPNGSESVNLRYIAKLADLSADTDTNDVLTKYPQIYIYGVLAHHGMLLGDTRIGIWQAAYETAKKQARGSDARDRHSGAPLIPSTRVNP